MGSMFRSLSEKVAKLLTLQSQVSTLSPSTSSSGGTPIWKDLEKLCRMTERIGALLDDAEEREIRESTVKQWLDELRDLAYDAEDVIEEFEYELLRNQPESKKEKRGAKKKRKLIVSKIRKINDRFDEIYQLRRALKLRKEDGQRHGTELLEPPVMMQSSSLVDQEGVSGRGKDKQKVIDMLLSDGSHCNEGIRVVSIVGMGGLGKTTLAQLVYNDALVESHFETKSWVCVSEPFDVTRITKAILESTSELEELSPLQESLRKKLEGKRFLLVLDDVWNENIRHWEALLVSFLSGAKGSRVLITTRSEKVSGISGAGEGNMYRLGCLSGEDSWLLFEKRAFSEKNSSDYPNLVRIGRKIVHRCKGLPLTLKTLAGLLFCQFSEESWKDILRSELWELPEGKDHILPALRRQIGLDVDGARLLRTYCKSMYGRRYFEDLLQRSFFQMRRYDFVMHNLIHDLARSISDGECCELKAGKVPTEKARHLRFQGECLVTPLHTDQLRRLRTFYMERYWHSRIKIDIVLSMKHLRVLRLYGLKIAELPDSIGNLKHLRYLEIGGRNICNSLPESLGNLINLQTLIVQDVMPFQELPESMANLVNLRYLDVPCDELQMMPYGFGRLTQLRRLPVFVVGEGSGAGGIEELAGLNDLQGSLIIRFRSVTRNKENNNSDNRVAEAAILSNKKGLESLTVDFDAVGALDEESGRASMGQQEEELIERLRPHTNVKHLEIRNYCGGRFPKWLGDPSYSFFPSLQKLRLENLPNCEGISVGTKEAGTFPTLGELIILRCYKLRYIKLRHLTALTKLEIRGCKELIELNYYDDVNVYLTCESSSWSGLEQQQQDRSMVDHMPCIHTMVLVGCPKLNFQPAQQQLPRSLRRLDVSKSLLVNKWVTSHVDKLFGLLDVNGTEIALRHAEKAWEMVISFNNYFNTKNKSIKLRWDPEQRQQAPSSSSAEDEGVLKKLGAPHGLKKFVIQGYRGWSLPSTWVADPDVLSKLQKITLSSCIHCQHLIPPLGRLPALDALEFCDMPEWKEWPEFQEEDGAFLRLEVLKIRNCPKLRTLQLIASQQNPLESESMDTVGRDAVSSSDLSEPACFGALSVLDIFSLPCLQSVSFAKISTLSEIYINNCPELVSLNNLHHHSTLQNIDILDCPRVEILLDKQLPNIINVTIDGIYRFGPELVDLWHAVDPSFKELIIQGYQDRSFPNWVGNYYASFSNVVKVTISNCIRCHFFPPLGQMPSLQRLYISKMYQIRRVGCEFYGGDHGAFPCLETLVFCDMPEWEEWQIVHSPDSETSEFTTAPSLETCN